MITKEIETAFVQFMAACPPDVNAIMAKTAIEICQATSVDGGPLYSNEQIELAEMVLDSAFDIERSNTGTPEFITMIQTA